MKKPKVMKYIIFLVISIYLNINFVSALSGDCVVCGGSGIAIPIAFPRFISNIIRLIQILVPVIIILVAMFDFFKAVINGDEKVFKETTSAFIKKIIAGVVIFLVIAIVKVAFSVIGDEGKNALSCVSCFFDADTCIQEVCPDRKESFKINCSTYTKEECESNSSKCIWKNIENGKCVSIEAEDDDGRSTVNETESGTVSGGGSR